MLLQWHEWTYGCHFGSGMVECKTRRIASNTQTIGSHQPGSRAGDTRVVHHARPQPMSIIRPPTPPLTGYAPHAGSAVKLGPLATACSMRPCPPTSCRLPLMRHTVDVFKQSSRVRSLINYTCAFRPQCLSFALSLSLAKAKHTKRTAQRVLCLEPFTHEKPVAR